MELGRRRCCRFKPVYVKLLQQQLKANLTEGNLSSLPSRGVPQAKKGRSEATKKKTALLWCPVGGIPDPLPTPTLTPTPSTEATPEVSTSEGGCPDDPRKLQ